MEQPILVEHIVDKILEQENTIIPIEKQKKTKTKSKKGIFTSN